MPAGIRTPLVKQRGGMGLGTWVILSRTLGLVWELQAKYAARSPQKSSGGMSELPPTQDQMRYP
jgi:hypothetical protein